MKIQLTHKYEEIISLENLLLAWQEFIVGKKSKPDVQIFGRNLMDNIISLHEDLKSGAYCHGGYESFFINDPKRRHIHKASVRDRLVHHAIYRILYPFFDRTFIGNSYSCRLDKGTHKAFNRFRAMTYKVSQNHTQTYWVLKCDIKKFFASIDHTTLMEILENYISDQNILWLLEQVIESFSTVSSLRGANRMSDEAISLKNGIATLPSVARNDDKIGLPLGNLTSQLFANVYLNIFDQWVKHKLKAKHYLRYADDFILLSPDKSQLENSISLIQNFLSEKLKLTLHPDKIFLKTIASGVDFLGWVHFLDHRVLRTVTKRRMMRRIGEYPTNETLQSYLGLLKYGNSFGIIESLLNEYWLAGPDWQLGQKMSKIG